MKRTRHLNHLTSYGMNVGSFLTDAKGSGQEGREPPTKPQYLRKWRLGRSSLRTGKPSTRAQRRQRSPMAKALSFSKLLAQRSLTRTQGNGPEEVGEMQKKLSLTPQAKRQHKYREL